MEHPEKPDFRQRKVWLTGVYSIILILAQNHRFWVFMKTTHRGGSNMYHQSMFGTK